MSNNKKLQRKFYKILDDLCLASGELSLAAIEAREQKDDNRAEIYSNAQSLINVAIKLIDPGCNPRFVVTVEKAKHHGKA